MLLYGKRIGRPEVGAAAALFTYASPIVLLDASIAYIDVALAAVLFALFYLLQIWDENRDPKMLVPIGLLAGFGYEVKYTAIVAVPYAVGFVAWKLWRERQPRAAAGAGGLRSSRPPACAVDGEGLDRSGQSRLAFRQPYLSRIPTCTFPLKMAGASLSAHYDLTSRWKFRCK